MQQETLSFIGTYIIPVVTAVTGWFAGMRKRKNTFLQDLQDSINLLSAENHRLLGELTEVNRDLVGIKKENAELKVAVDRLCSENSQLKEEVRGLRLQLSKKNTPA
ncbi:MAG: hypothetical protein MJY68_00045 [Bacteroidaceae bacterium]|nr:hypothetical protein [Bacteroidaceae bacterium]